MVKDEKIWREGEKKRIEKHGSEGLGEEAASHTAM